MWPTLFSALQFRFTEYQNESRTFCRRFTVSSNHSIRELFYDCRWTRSSDFGKTFIFQYEAQNQFYREAGRYWFKLPSYSELGKKFTCTRVCVCVFCPYGLFLGAIEVNISKPPLVIIIMSISLHVIGPKLLA